MSITTSMIEAALFLLTAVAVHLSLSPPNPPVNKGECYFEKDGKNGFFELFVQSITFCSKVMVWIGSLCNLRKITIHSFFLDKLHVDPVFGCRCSGLLSNGRTHPLLFLGAFCVVIGTALRLWCFKSLGPLFTFEITIRPEHELITHGPYAWVRHPSYTGVYLTLLGATLVLIGPGTWMKECGVKMPLGLLFICLWLVKCFIAFRGMHMRHRTEDDVLSETFGKEWEEYASRVPHKFIPYVL